MSKQVYTVKNSKGQVIGARQSARAYTHALIINDTQVEATLTSMQSSTPQRAGLLTQPSLKRVCVTRLSKHKSMPPVSPALHTE